MQDCFDFYFYHENDQKMTEEECTQIVHEKLFPTQPPTISTTTKKTTTTRPTTTTRRTTRPTTRQTTRPTTRPTKKPTQAVTTTTEQPTTLKKTTTPVAPKKSRVFSPEAIYVSRKKTTERPEIVTIPPTALVNTELPDDIDDLFMGFTAEAIKPAQASTQATKKPTTTPPTTTKKPTTTTSTTTTTTTKTTTSTTTTTTTTIAKKIIEQPEAKPVQVQPVETIVIPSNPIRSPVPRSPLTPSGGDKDLVELMNSDSAFNSVSSPKKSPKSRSKCGKSKNGKSCGSHGKCKLVNGEYTCVCQEKYTFNTKKERCIKSRRKEKTPKWSRWSKWGECSTTCDEGE